MWKIIYRLYSLDEKVSIKLKNNDHKSLQYAATLALNSERMTKIKPSVDNITGEK